MRITKRRVKGRTYYYLEQTVRDKGKRATKSRYLGSEVPKEVDELRRQFQFELDQEKWFKGFERIRQGYAKELGGMPGSAREKALRQFSVEFTYDTQRIEGSTLTLRETAELLEHGVSPGAKPIADAKEAEAHDRLFRHMLDFKGDLTQKEVLEWNWRLLKDTKPDVAGKVRRHGVGISGSRFAPPPPVELQPRLDAFFDWYRGSRRRMNPVELAALVHLRFVTIHPFADGNGRVSRLMMNFALHRGGYPMLNIEYSRRNSYYASLEKSQVGGDDRPFLNWFFRRYAREHARFLE